MRRAVPTLACVLALLLGLVGCGDDDPAPPDGASTSTPAAKLRARLAATLQSQAYLAGAAALAGARNGFDSESHQEATLALEEQDAMLQRAVTSVAGARAGGDVARRTAAVSEALDRYARARTLSDVKATAQASAQLAGARARLSAALAGATRGLDAKRLDALVVPQSQLQKAAIDSLVNNRTTASTDLARAAERAAALAMPLADGLVRRAGPKRLPGEPDGAGSTLRTLLTTQLGDHAHLVGTVSREIVGQGASSPGALAARRTLRDEATLLEETVGATWGDGARTEFASIWRTHLKALEAYSLAKSRVDDDAARAALAALDTFRSDLTAFLVRRSDGELTGRSLRGLLTAYVDDATATTRAFATGAPEAYTRFQATADRMPLLAAVLARGIVRQFPDRFPGD